VPDAAGFQRLIPRFSAWLMLSNAAGAVILFVYFSFIQGNAEGLANNTKDTQISIAVFVAYLAATFPFGIYSGARTFSPVLRWLAEDRPPTESEQRIVLSQPFRQASWSFAYWVGAAIVFGLLQLSFHNGAERAAAIVLGILLGGLATCALCFLLVERTLRPLFAYALQEGTPQRSNRLGIRPRLVLSWVLGSGIPLVGLLLLPFGRTGPGRQHLAAPVAFLAAIGLISGFVILVGAARSVADPLEEIRSALARIQAGDLDVEVTVNDGGEVGLLQSGVNRMAHGLRERQQLEDLFGRYVGEAVAHQALESGFHLQGERREVSALFVDIIGSTAMAGSLPPEQMVRVLNAFFGAIVHAIGTEGGWVNKFEGDGALCVFGAPGAQADHATRALRAARALRADLASVAAEYPGLDAAIGVSSGRVVAGNVGSERRYEFTVIGDPVNEASRLTDLAKGDPGRVLAAEQAVRAAGAPESDHWIEDRIVTLRGRSQPTCAYRPRDGKKGDGVVSTEGGP
jgi:adenylate cyclase